jgi:hypothetical protein
VIHHLLVLEAPWNGDTIRSTSVWPFVSEYCRVHDIEAHRQHFTDLASFRHWVRCYNDEKLDGRRLLYIAAHGNPGSLGALTRSLNASSVIDTLAEAPKIDYVHFGSCLFGNPGNLDRLMQRAAHLRWAAGYDVEIPWIESMAFDLMFWSKVDGTHDEDAPRRQPHRGVTDLLGYTDKLAGKLGFRFHYRRGAQVLSLP